MLFSFDIENTVEVYFDIKFILPDEKQQSNCENRQVSTTCFWSRLVSLYQKSTWLSIYDVLLIEFAVVANAV